MELVYNHPIGFDEVVDVQASLARIGETNLTSAGGIGHDGDVEPSVTAMIVRVCVDPDTRRAAAIPDETRAAPTVLDTNELFLDN